MSEYRMLKKVGMLVLTIIGVRMAFKSYFDSHSYPKYPVDHSEDLDDEEELIDECEDDEDESDSWADEILDAAAEADKRSD